MVSRLERRGSVSLYGRDHRRDLLAVSHFRTWSKQPATPKINNGYCIQVTAGGVDWASFATW
jgi:hypothetical protein